MFAREKGREWVDRGIETQDLRREIRELMVWIWIGWRERGRE